MKYKIKKSDFEIIETLDNSNILFYTQNSQIFSLDNDTILNYFKYCSDSKLTNDNRISVEDEKNIFEFVNREFEQSLSANHLKHEPPQKLNMLILPISGNCNLTCKYCFARINDEFGFSDVTIEDAKSIYKYLFEENGLENITISFFGGEPFMNFKLIKFSVDYINQNYKDKKVTFSVTTNGTILNFDQIKFIKENNIATLVSLDGTKNANKYRVFRNGKNSFDKTLSNILNFKKYDIDISIRATVTNDNKDLLDTYKFFEDLKILFSIVFAYESENRNHSLANYSHSINIIKKQLNEVLEYYLQRISNNKKIHCQYLLEKFLIIALRKKSNYACSGGHSLFSITSNGDIYTCEHLVGKKEYSIGNIKLGSELYNSDLRSQNVSTNNNCQFCWARFICSGGCFSSNLSITGDIKKPQFEKCELIREEWKFVISLYCQIKKTFPDYFKLMLETIDKNETC